MGCSASVSLPPVELQVAAGVALLDLAGTLPFIGPLALMAATVARQCQELSFMDSDLLTLAMCIQYMERTLVKTKHKLADKKDIIVALEKCMQDAVNTISMIKSNKYTAYFGSQYSSRSLQDIRDQINSILQMLTFDMTVDLHSLTFHKEQELQKYVDDVGLENLGKEEHMEHIKKCMSGSDKVALWRSDTNYQKLQQELRISRSETIQNVSLLQKQNEILMNRVEQLNYYMEERDYKMKDFSEKFPMCPTEARRNQVIEKYRLMDLEWPCKELEELLDKFCDILDKQEHINIVNLDVNLSNFHTLEWIVNRTKDLETGEWLGRNLGSITAPREICGCQYVVADGSVKCFNKTNKQQPNSDIFEPKEFAALLHKAENISGYGDTSELMSFMQNLAAPKDPLEVVIANKQKLAAMEGFAYVGAPIEICDQTVAVLCYRLVWKGTMEDLQKTVAPFQNPFAKEISRIMQRYSLQCFPQTK